MWLCINMLLKKALFNDLSFFVSYRTVCDDARHECLTNTETKYYIYLTTYIYISFLSHDYSPLLALKKCINQISEWMCRYYCHVSYQDMDAAADPHRHQASGPVYTVPQSFVMG